MAWTTIPDKSTGDLMDETWYDTHFKANMEHLKSLIEDKAAARVSASSSISVASASLTALTFDTETFDTDNLHDASSNTSRLTASRDGKWLVGCAVAWSGFTSANDVRHQIKLNGSTVVGRNQETDDNNWQVTFSTVVDLSQNDYAEVVVYQNSGSARTVTAAEFWMIWLSE